MQKSRVSLIILDGWGIGPEYPGNAERLAKTPTLNMLWNTFPHTELLASGEAVGLPKGEVGNTETGHLNIGAGRIVYQDLPRINMAIASGTFFQNKAFLKAADHVKTQGSSLHILGLIGQGGVHSVNEHLYALLRFAKNSGVPTVYLHLITDGRDSAPTSSPMYLEQVQKEIEEIGIGKIASVLGRYYAMDRDHRWERTKVAYDALVNGVGETSADIVGTINARYSKGKTDEFLKPIIVPGTARIHDNDAVIFYNYRIDRPRQLTRALTLPENGVANLPESFDPYAVKYHKTHLLETPQSTMFARDHLPKNLCFVTMTQYEKDFPVEVAFPPEFVEMPLSRIIALNGLRQLKLAESEKERFVTYYFNGQRELAFPGEDVDITASPKVATYDLQPEMSGVEQTKKLLAALNGSKYDLVVINYANPDMVAHTGNLQATIKACELVDGWLREVYGRVMQTEGMVAMITADHGHAEQLTNPTTGGVATEHTASPVPFIMFGQQFLNQGRTLTRGILADIAPTILKILGLEKPQGMTGRSLI